MSCSNENPDPSARLVFSTIFNEDGATSLGTFPSLGINIDDILRSRYCQVISISGRRLG